MSFDYDKWKSEMEELRKEIRKLSDRVSPSAQDFSTAELMELEKGEIIELLSMSSEQLYERLKELMDNSEERKQNHETMREFLSDDFGERPSEFDGKYVTVAPGDAPFTQVTDPEERFYRGPFAGFQSEIRKRYHDKYLEVLRGDLPEGKTHRDVYRVLMHLFAHEMGEAEATLKQVVPGNEQVSHIEVNFREEPKSREKMVQLVDKVLSEPETWEDLRLEDE